MNWGGGRGGVWKSLGSCLRRNDGGLRRNDGGGAGMTERGGKCEEGLEQALRQI